MSERKVLNKYYPPDYDPSKLPRVKREKNRQFTIRLMAPFNMRCKTCGEYIYRGKKFNARKEDVIGKTYLGIQVYRFYIKCTKCLAEITFLTDPENQDYEMECGAIRNFESIRLAEKQAELEAKQEKEEEKTNPMKILENRTRDSKREMTIIETLEDLKELNAANSIVDPLALLEAEKNLRKQIEKKQIEEDEEEIRRIFGKAGVKRGLDGQSTKDSVGIKEEEEASDDNEYDEEDESKEYTLPDKYLSIKSESLAIKAADSNKKLKTEPTEVEVKEHGLFSKASGLCKQPIQAPTANNNASKFNKSTISSFIKKKESVITSNNNQSTSITPTAQSSTQSSNNAASNSLNLLAAYADDSSDQDSD